MIKNLFLLPFLFLVISTSSLFSQNQVGGVNITNEPSVKSDMEMPRYSGGDQEMMNYLKKNIQYPSTAISNKISGTVFVSFFVEEDGKISDVSVLKGVAGDKEGVLEKEAVRVVSAMPQWIPGRENGKPVRAKYTLPVKFALN